MINKALRILIADSQHFHRMKIERLFNSLDYYRVAPAQSLTELLTLVDYGCEPFDVVVVNAELASGSLDLLGFFLDNPQVRQALIYNEATAPLHPVSGFAQENVQINHLALPSKHSISQLMTLADAPARPEKPAAHMPRPQMQYAAYA
ncbi:chemotaxis protein CheY [Pseudomonas sp. rhizo66]|uniref:chemotaxis protein CheY n=1 Tax=Pseudomonas sp. rhizo66 TaxID=3059674 RepID=UPI002891D2F6|nr:chemotaxis protein CheY [Pseudomonas sp. rhizo66]MDT3311999.1 chemotaxis protein CheY [Pseudomonas sp. rhizo66]